MLDRRSGNAPQAGLPETQQRKQLLQLTDVHRPATSMRDPDEPPQKPPECPFRALSIEGARRVCALELLDVEADPTDALLFEEVEQLIRVLQRFAAEDRDDVGVDAGCSEPSQTGQGRLQRAVASAGLAMPVVQGGGAVDADADPGARIGEKQAPGIVDQGRIGLEREAQLGIARQRAVEDPNRRLVEGDRTDKWLATVSEDRQLLPDQAGFGDPLSHPFEGIKRHATLLVSVRQIAVVAVQIAERCRLDHQ
jgi:hypothetical protein